MSDDPVPSTLDDGTPDRTRLRRQLIAVAIVLALVFAGVMTMRQVRRQAIERERARATFADLQKKLDALDAKVAQLEQLRASARAATRPATSRAPSK